MVMCLLYQPGYIPRVYPVGIIDSIVQPAQLVEVWSIEKYIFIDVRKVVINLWNVANIWIILFTCGLFDVNYVKNIINNWNFNTFHLQYALFLVQRLLNKFFGCI